jgi:hypothetical protein
MEDWERQQSEDMFREQASQYMSDQTWHMKNQQARQQMNDLYGGGDGGGGDILDTLFGIGIFLFVVGFLVYALFTHIFGG